MDQAAIAKVGIEPPRHYQGVFRSATQRFLPLLEEAREGLRELPVPDIARAHYLELVVSRPQPAFVLFPLMYLHLADATGGVTERHRAYLPFQMLAMELIALYDDTVDYTPVRSGSPTYTARHGAVPATVLAGVVHSTLVQHTATMFPELSPMLVRAFENLCARELWEHGARHPHVSEDSLASWMRCRNAAIPPIISYSLDGALMLHGLEPIPEPVHARFGDLQQDVDDLINIVEEREKVGENDDIKLGIPSYPLLATLRAEPSATQLLEEIWAPLRGLPPASLEADLALRDPALIERHRELVELIVRHGIAATVEKVIADAEAVSAGAPVHVWSCLREYAFSIVDRLRHLDPRARFEEHIAAPWLASDAN